MRMKKKKNLNKVANEIINLNKKDQSKVMKILKADANDKDKEQQYDKLNKLVNNLNNFKLYIKYLVKDRVGDENSKKELPESVLTKISNEIQKNLYEENPETINTPIDEKISNSVNIILKLHKNDQEKILDNLKQNAKDDNTKKIYRNLFNMVRFKKRINIIQNNSKPKLPETEKISYTPEELTTVSEDFAKDLFSEELTPSNETEILLSNQNKDNKVKEIADEIKK